MKVSSSLLESGVSSSTLWYCDESLGSPCGCVDSAQGSKADFLLNIHQCLSLTVLHCHESSSYPCVGHYETYGDRTSTTGRYAGIMAMGSLGLQSRAVRIFHTWMLLGRTNHH